MTCSGWPSYARERDVARDHQRLGDRGIAGEAELGGDRALVHLPVARERRLLLVQRETAAGDRRVLERAAHRARGERTGCPSSVKPAAPASASSPISVSSAPRWPFVIAARKPTGTSASAPRLLDERPEHRGRVDDRIGVRHREDRAVAARRRGRGAGRDRLLVLAAGRAQVHVRIDERRREHEAVRVDDPVRVPLERRADRGDHAVVDADVDVRVDALDGVEHARAA